MRKLYNKFDKTIIQTLPKVLFEGKIVVVQSKQDADKAVDYLLKQPILGFDTETKPSFKRGTFNKVSLLQVSSHDICFLFRLNHIGLTDSLIRLLSDNEVLKIGLSWRDDVTSLHRRKDFPVGKFVEIQELVREFGIKDQSLQKLYANIFQQKISKSQRLSNWEADVFTEGQKRYAATDAWACIMLYEELQKLRAEGFELIEVIEEKDEQDNISQEG